MHFPGIAELASIRFSIRAHRRPPGQAPGTLEEPPGAFETSLSLRVWTEEGHVASEPEDLDPVREAISAGQRVWLNVTGLQNLALLREVGALLGIHPLWLEDMLNTRQRPKQELDPERRALFVVLQMAGPGSGLPLEQVSLHLKGNVLLTVQERPGDAFEPVRQRLARGDGRMRSGGADWMLYALVDALVDGYYAPLEALGEELDQLEEAALDRPHPTQLVRIRGLKRVLLHHRRALWPMREVLAALEREDRAGLAADTRLHLRDCHDHVLQLLDLVETFREVASGLMDVYLSSVSNRMNEVMKVLTIIATLFIPLTFVAGVYGMNFDPDVSPWNMPELGWRYGYPVTLLAMALIAGTLLLWFRRRGWLGGGV